MTLYDIASMQGELDERILKLHGLTKEETFRKRILALLVELGELANETRCFKFWSNKASSEKAVVLDEYVDVLHFLVSLGNDLGINFGIISYEQEENCMSLSELFLTCYQTAADLIGTCQEQEYLSFLRLFFQLGHGLDFSFEDIVAGYVLKNEVNHLRQNSNY